LVRHQVRSIALVLPSQKITAQSLQSICDAVGGILQDAIPQVVEAAHEVAPERKIIETRIPAAKKYKSRKATRARLR
jgi:hypothetical protein